MHEVLVNRLGGLSLPRKSVVRLTDRPDMTLDVYRGRKTTMQHMKREFKPCVYCNTVTNHSFRFSYLEILLNVQNGKSNVQVDPSLHCMHTTERPFSRHTIYIRMQVS